MWTVVTMGKDELRESSGFSMYVLVYCLSRFQSACLEILFCENENNLTKKKVAGHPPHPPAHALLVPVQQSRERNPRKHVCGAACKRQGSTESNCGKEGGVTEAKGSETEWKELNSG